MYKYFLHVDCRYNIINKPESKVKTQTQHTYKVSHLTVCWAAQTCVEHHDLVQSEITVLLPEQRAVLKQSGYQSLGHIAGINLHRGRDTEEAAEDEEWPHRAVEADHGCAGDVVTTTGSGPLAH